MMHPTGSQRQAPGEALGVDTALGPAGTVPDRLTPYLVFLLVCLSLAGFFDSFATSFRYTMLTYVREDFQVSFASMADLFTWVYLGSCLSFIPRALADVLGRRIMLWTTMVALCGLQWVLGFARTPYEYTLMLVFLAVFYKSDIWMLIMSEEAPPKHRGLFAALTVAISASGVLVLGELVRQMGPATDAWRDVARFPIWGLFASIPVLLFMRETHHFRGLRSSATSKRYTSLRLLGAPFRRQFVKPLIVMSLLKMLFGGGAIVTMALIGTEYLRVDNGFPRELVGRIVQLDVLAIMAAWAIAGFLSDRIGRHRCLYLFGAIYVAALLHLALLPKGSMGVVIAHVAQCFAGIGVFSILRVATMELFPNDCRATGSAWTELLMTLFAAATARALSSITASTASAEHGVALSTCIIAVAVGVPFVLPFFALVRETRGQKLEEVC